MTLAHRCLRHLPSLLLLLALAGPIAPRTHAQGMADEPAAPTGMAEPDADADTDNALAEPDADAPMDAAPADAEPLDGDLAATTDPEDADPEAADPAVPEATADDIAQATRTTPFDDTAEHPNRIAAPGHYPRILPAWKAAPITTGDLFSAPESEYVDDATVLLQQHLLASADPLLRARTALQLGTTGNRLAFDLLSAAIAAEQDPAVLASLLNAQRIIAAPGVVAPALRLAIGPDRHPSRYVRLAAIQLYALAPAPDKTAPTRRAIADAIAAEPDPQTRTAMLRAIADQPAALTPARWIALSIHPALTAPQHAIPLGALAAHPEPDAATLTRLLQAAKSPDLGARAAIATRLGRPVYTHPSAPGTPSLPTLLRQDTHPAVRAAFALSLSHFAPIPTTGSSTQASSIPPLLAPALLPLLQDPDLEVRYQATASAARASSEDTLIPLLAERLGDPDSVRIRRAAEDGFVQHGTHTLTASTAQMLRDLLADTNPERRYHAARAIAALHLDAQRALHAGHEDTPSAARHTDLLIAFNTTLLARLPLETDPRVLVTEIDTLSALLLPDALPPILLHTQHTDPTIRAAVARAIGRYAHADSADLLRSYVAEDPAPEVINAALQSMGHLDADFSSTLLSVLTKTNDSTGRLSGASRAIACWSAARQRSPDKKLLARLEQQVIKPVIPTPMGPIYEDDTVRVSATLALAEHFLVNGNHDVEVKLRRTLGMIGMQDADATGNNPPPTGAQLREAAWQIRAYLNGQAPDAIQPHTAPVTHPVLDYRPLSN